ncbi:alpha/beta hydrolase [Mycobacterium sp. MYCO198283]|uniref:alpha/beta hydrolase n=1 Tax=Mycobacterium sp. MYCO198283 TaxID=2883505 RepID=UPI001E3DE145|nr:alpha/beta hydrolase fold domain-containing protein [Mycobacterium sp. MYCO198283]MCG5434245.1 alpha/beta hydrolase [Mycobacterium sp. MYCO198283]
MATDAADPVHPDLRRIARLVPAQPVRPVLLPLLRRATGRLTGRPARGVEVLRLSSGMRVRVHRPPTAGPGAALLWIHGGGYLLGSPAQDDRLCRRFADALGITVAAVEYRLAPAHPYPAALQDCYAALRWLSTLPAVDPARIAIGGASAGGGLAAALALWARDHATQGDAPVAFQLLVYPMLDDRSATGDPRHRLWTARSNRLGWAAYLGDADPAVAVPARRTDLAGLPPAWIGVGTHDLFHDEDLAYSQRLRAAGVPCDVEVVPGAFHGFDAIAPRAHVSRLFFEKQCAAMASALTLDYNTAAAARRKEQP